MKNHNIHGTLRPTVRPTLSRLPLALAAIGLHGLAVAADASPSTPVAASATAASAASPAAAAAQVQIIGTRPLDSTGTPLSQVPTNVQRLGAADIREQGSAHLADLLQTSLGSVSLSNGPGNPYQSDVNFRGFQASSLLGAPVGLSVWLDGVRMNEPFGAVVNWDLIAPNAIRSLDVLPGSNPNFGGNTLGGALAVSTRNGLDDPGAEIELNAGSFRRRGVQATAGGAGEDRRTDWFVALNRDQQDGYRAHSSSLVNQAFGKGRWRSEDGRSELGASLALANNVLHGTQSLPMDMLADPTSAYTWPDSTDNSFSLAQLKGRHALGDHDQISASLHVRHARTASRNSNAGLDDGCFSDDGTLATTTAADGSTVVKCAGKAPGGTAVNSVTSAAALALGYGRWTSSINAGLVDSLTRQKTVGSSLQWTHDGRLGNLPHVFNAGLSLERSLIDYTQTNTLARLVDYQSVVIPNTEYGFTADGAAPSATNRPQFNGSNVLGDVQLHSLTHALSLSLADTLQLNETWSLSAALSLDHSSLSQRGANHQYLNDDGGYSWTDAVSGQAYYNPAYVGAYKYSNTAASGVATANAIPAGAMAGPQTNDLAGDHHFHRLNPALGLNFNPSRDLGLFAAYSEALRTPTSIELSCADPERPCALPTGFNGDPDLLPVVARTLELGARGRLGAALTWNAAVYDTRLRNDIQFIATSTSYGYFANVGNTERRGFELGADGRWGAWSAGLSLGQVEATYQSSFTTADGQDVTPGKRIPGIPSRSLKLRGRWAATADLSLGAQVQAVNRQFAHGNESNTDPDGVLPGYALLNLDAQWRLSPRLSVALRVNNAADRRCSNYGLAGVTSLYSMTEQAFRTPGAPRTLGFTLRYEFDRPAAGRAGA